MPSKKALKKILAITSIRSDYDLMSSLYIKLHADPEIELKLLVSGAHLSHTYGRSIDLIRQDGLDILLPLETLLDSDSASARLKTASLLLQNAIAPVAAYRPDLIIFAGDREDVIVGALLGGYLGIPALHFYGGDHTQDGHIDNPVRHATSKLATAHFVTIEEHKKRLIRLGEDPKRIFTIGSIALDRFCDFTPIPKRQLHALLNMPKFYKNFALLIFHPIQEENEESHEIFENILFSLEQTHIHAFVSAPNTDPGNKKILDIIEKYKKHSGFFFFKNLERSLFLSIFKNAEFIIGNSSAGILESASIPIPAINVGLRQKGRSANNNVIFCKTHPDAITSAIKIALSFDFKEKISTITNQYGTGSSAYDAVKIIKDTDFSSMFFKTEDPLSVNFLL